MNRRRSRDVERPLSESKKVQQKSREATETRNEAPREVAAGSAEKLLSLLLSFLSLVSFYLNQLTHFLLSLSLSLSLFLVTTMKG